MNDDGSCAGLPISDELLRELADLRSDGTILPLPTMSVEKRSVMGCELAVITVQPSRNPPVRVRGRTKIRVGTRRGVATLEEEQRLIERVRSRMVPFDVSPVVEAMRYLGLAQRFGIGLTLARQALAANGNPVPELQVTDTHVLVTVRRSR